MSGGCSQTTSLCRDEITTATSSSTAAYCQARKDLDISSLEAILKHTSTQLQPKVDSDRLNGRRVIVVDGTGVSMPDTEANQLVWTATEQPKTWLWIPTGFYLRLFLSEKRCFAQL
jgi:hypothetical protein